MNEKIKKSIKYMELDDHNKVKMVVGVAKAKDFQKNNNDISFNYKDVFVELDIKRMNI